jgi:hypothetical protein
MKSITVALTLLALLVLASPALAKGPEAGTLTGPGIETPIEFLDQSEPPDEMASPPPELLGMTGLFIATGTPLNTPPDVLGEGYTVQWQMFGTGDVIEQHLYPDAAGGPVIHTPDQFSLSGWGAVDEWVRGPNRLGEAIDAVVEWAQPEPAEVNRSWTLPIVLVIAVAALVLWGRRLPDYGAQASINLANDATV